MGLSIRTARPSDLDELIEIEFASFNTDRISPRSWQDLLVSQSAVVLVAEQHGSPAGCTVVLFNARTSVARIYSLAVKDNARGHGIGGKLLETAIAKAGKRDCVAVRLETRIDNLAAQALFSMAGFRQTGLTTSYYEDGATALRFEFLIAQHREAAE